MIYFSSIVSYFIENKRSMFVFLLFFHVVISVILFSLANTEYFSSLHNGEGLWNFARDSSKYHNEALDLMTYIKKSEWSDWWHLYPNHQHVKAISLTYWLTGYYSPISYEIVSSVVWATSFLLIVRASELLFPGDIKALLITSIFFFQPSLLISSTQLLRDPIYILGFCFIFYGFTIFSKQNSKWKWVFMIQFGFILMVLMRQYIGLILLIFLLLFVVIVFFQKKISDITKIAPLLVFIIPLILYQNHSSNLFISVDEVGEWKQQNILLDTAVGEQSQVCNDVYIKKGGLGAVLFCDNVSNHVTLKTVRALDKLEVYRSRFERYIEYHITQGNQEQTQTTPTVIQEQTQTTPTVIQEQTQTTPTVIEGKFDLITILDGFSRKLNNLRAGYGSVNIYAGSRIDADKKIFTTFEAVLYLPRVIQIGFLSPFPLNWLKKGVEVGTIGNLLAGLEMFIWYFILLGFIYITYKNPSVIKPFSIVFLISILIIVLLGYVVPNVGAIYRMRQAYMIPFYVFGAHGLSLMISNFNKKQH